MTTLKTLQNSEFINHFNDEFNDYLKIIEELSENFLIKDQIDSFKNVLKICGEDDWEYFSNKFKDFLNDKL